MPGCDCFALAVPILRPALRALQSLLRVSELARTDPGPARIVDMLTVARGRETGDANIDPRLAASRWQRVGRHIVTGQHQHPAPPAALDLNRLDPPHHRAMQLNFDLADALQIHPLSL